MKDKSYDIFKWLALVGLPASGVLYYSLAEIWHLPNADEVTRTVMALELFLGTVLGISHITYNKNESEEQ